MQLNNKKYTVFSSMEVNQPLENFDVVHNPENINISDFHMARVFRIEQYDGPPKTVALVDLICSEYEPYAVLEENILTTILFQAIVRIDLDNGSIAQYTECDNMGGLFEIHSIEDGYIIWGEGDIFRYDRDLNRVWHFMGRDILVSLNNDRHFWFENDRIHCRDFEGWHYVLDFDGKLLDDFREVSEDEIL